MARILIVEDSSAMRAYVRSVLESEPAEAPGAFEVVEAANGFDALRLLPRGAFDLLITDINMPEINGLELIQFVRKSEQYNNLAILIISTQAAERDVTRGLELGANGFLGKPFTQEQLLTAVDVSLRGRGEARG
jgi:two-component system chemotaxis response regulator CheY